MLESFYIQVGYIKLTHNGRVEGHLFFNFGVRIISLE